MAVFKLSSRIYQEDTECRLIEGLVTVVLNANIPFIRMNIGAMIPDTDIAIDQASTTVQSRANDSS